MSQVTPTAKKIIANIEKVVIGKRQEIILALVAYLSEGHILLEDVPGVAKTMLAALWRQASAARLSGCSARPTCCPTTSPAPRSSIPKRPSSNSVPAPSLPRSCWPTKSIAPRRERRRHCSKRWRSGGSPSTANLSARAALPRDRHAKPDRSRRDLSASRGTARSLSRPAQPGLSRQKKKERCSTCCGTSTRSISSKPSCRPPTSSPASKRSATSMSIRKFAITSSNSSGNTREHDDHRARRKSAGFDCTLPRRAGAGRDSRTRLCPSRRRQADGRPRPRSSADPAPGKPAAEGHVGRTSSTKFWRKRRFPRCLPGKVHLIGSSGNWQPQQRVSRPKGTSRVWQFKVVAPLGRIFA